MHANAERRTRGQMIAETTGKLISAARRAFAQRGYAETSMDELCAEVGLTRGALYHHFGGKEGLLEAVVRQIDAEFGARLDAQYAAIADPWEAFRACCDAYLGHALDPEVQRIVLRDAPAVLGQRFREIDASLSLQPTIDCLAALMESGRLRRADPEALARLVNGAILDAALWVAGGGDAEETLRRARQALEVLLEGLEARPG
jgi:AcrR family transcriptional regulator